MDLVRAFSLVICLRWAFDPTSEIISGRRSRKFFYDENLYEMRCFGYENETMEKFVF